MIRLVKRFSKTGLLILTALALLLLIGCRRSPSKAAPVKPTTEGTSAQKLALLLEIAADPNSPIKFDKKLSEFQLIYTRVKNGETSIVNWPMKFCPFTGTRLESGRAAAFYEPSQRETESMLRRLESASTIEEISRVLGKPDLSYGSNEWFRQQFSYTNVAKTFDVIVQEDHDGKASVCFFGKPKE
jgi:hypothetical protein